jgi:hypothetical protein
LFSSPAIQTTLPLPTSASLVPGGSTGFIPHLADGSRIYLATTEQGAGRVVLAAFSRPFSNQGLKETAHPALVANVLALARNPGLVWVDEWHHGIRLSPAARGPESWLRRTPIGRSILYAAALVFLALFLQGRNFGRPLSPSRQVRRRGP